MNLAKLLSLAFSAATLSVGLNPGAIAAGPGPYVPFTATLGITEHIELTRAACPLTAAVSGGGTATHLGRVTVSSDDCILPRGATLDFISPNVVLTAANGDQIFASYAGRVRQADGAISGSYAISGGTGRFENARGTGDLVGVEDLSPFNVPSNPPATKWTILGEITLSGTISY